MATRTTEATGGHAAEAEAADAALRFARRAHRGQRRKQNRAPYVEHPIAVAELLSGSGAEQALVAAAYLHDVVEKTAVGGEQIRSSFGPRVAGLVEALSEDPAIEGYAARKRALREQVLAAGREATLIYAADRVANLRDWVGVPAGKREQVAERLGTTVAERLLLWEEDLHRLTEYDRELPFLPEIELALGELRGAG